MSRVISSNELWDKATYCFQSQNRLKSKNSFMFQEEFGKVFLNHFSTGHGIRYISFCGTFKEDTILENDNSGDSSFFCFNTGDNFLIEDSIGKKRVEWGSDICWSGEQALGHKSRSLYSKNNKNTSHYIIFENNIFKELVKSNEEFQKAQTIYKGEYIDVNFNNTLTFQQKVLLEDLVKASAYNDKLQVLYLESKLLDLVYTTINGIQATPKNSSVYLSSKDVECLNNAKQILINNMKNPPSLKELAYKSAINEFKLKKGFKELFGNTVFGYLQEFRLNEAKALLESNEINIGEASSLVGYKSISHFSKIFKEHFGVTPIEIKKEQKRIYI